MIGLGAFGTVVRAKERSTGKVVAIKLVSHAHQLKYHKTLSVQREEEILMRLKGHPFIIELFHTTQDDKNLYLIFEYCENGDLQTLLKQKCKSLPLPPCLPIQTRVLVRRSHKNLRCPNSLHPRLPAEKWHHAPRSQSTESPPRL